MTTFTTLWRLAVITPFDPAVKDSWGPIQDSTMPLMEQGAVGITSVNIAGLTSVSLTTANNATDQARFYRQNYTGLLTGACTVTVPNLQKVGEAVNNTTGGFNVILSAGGTTAILPPDGLTYLWECDGATNIVLTKVGLAQFAPVATASGSITLPGGILMKWGNGVTDGTGGATVVFPVAFPNQLFSVVATLRAASGPGTNSLVIGGSSTFTFQVYATNAGGTGQAANFYWFAIGN